MKTECEGWTGKFMSTGYGIVYVAGEEILAHRLAYMSVYGDIPEGHDIHHMCGNKACVNINHLKCMPSTEHKSTYVNQYKGATHCIHGHEFTEENTKWYNNMRICITCKRRVAREWARRNYTTAAERR